MSERPATRLRIIGTPRTALGLAMLVGLLARVWIVLQAPVPHFAADDLFDRLAWNLVSLHTFTLDGTSPAAHVAPLYPAVLSCFYAIVGHRPEWVPALHIAFDLAASFCLYRIGTMLWGPWTGAWSAALFLLYPAYWTYDSRIRSEVLLTLLICGWVWASVACARGPCARRYAMLGLLAGLAILCKPVVLVPAGLLAGLPWTGAVPLSRKFAYAGLYLAATLTIVLPWSVRNYVAFHDFIPVSAGIGAGLWMGSDSASHGSWPMPTEREQALWDSAGITPLPYAHVMYDVATDRMLREKGWERIKSAPLAYLGLSMVRVWDFWIGNSFYLGNGQEGIVSGLRKDAAERGWLVAAYSLTKRLVLIPAMMAAALWSAWCFRERWRELLPLYVFPIGLTLGYVPFTVEAGRYALPVLPCLMVLSVAWAIPALTTRSFLSSGYPASHEASLSWRTD
jgi:4-amino-4-deoxy-L-arabinose transferase-like glycosyltransferase